MAFPYNTAGEPNPPAVTHPPAQAHAVAGTRQRAAAKPKVKKVQVRAHTRVHHTTPRPAAPRPPKAPAKADPYAKLIAAATRLRYGPQEQALQQGLNLNTRFTSGVPTWYDQAKGEIAAIKAQGAAQQQAGLNQVTQYASQPTLPNATDQQAAGARNNLNAEFAARTAGNSSADQAMLDRISAATSAQQGNTLSGANLQRQQLVQQKAALKGQEGDFRTTYGAQLQAAQAKQDFANANFEFKKAVAQETGLYHEGQLRNQQAAINSLDQNRKAGQKVARTNARTQRQNARTNEIKARNDAMNKDRQYKLDVAKYGAAVAKQNWQQNHPKPSDQKTAADLAYFKKHGYYPPTGPPDKNKGVRKPPTQGQTKTNGQVADAIRRYQQGLKRGEPRHQIAADGRAHGVNQLVLDVASWIADHPGKPLPGSVKKKLAQLGIPNFTP